MYVKCSFVLTLCLYIELTISTDLHKNHLTKGDMSEFLNPFMLRHSPSKLKRIGRHVELKSGNVMSRLLNEVGNGRHNVDDGNSNQFIRRALRIIEMKLKRLMKNKNKMHLKNIHQQRR